MKKLCLSLFIFLIFNTLVNSQKTITGIIKNSETDAPVEFVNVFLQSNQSRGVLSNQEGKSALYFFEVTSKMKGEKGKRLHREKNLRDLNYTYNKDFWNNNEVLLQVDAPKALSSDLGRTKIYLNSLKRISTNAKKSNSVFEPIFVSLHSFEKP